MVSYTLELVAGLIGSKILRGSRVDHTHLEEWVILQDEQVTMLRGSRRLLTQTLARGNKFKLPRLTDQTSPNDPFDHI